MSRLKKLDAYPKVSPGPPRLMRCLAPQLLRHLQQYSSQTNLLFGLPRKADVNICTAR